MQKCGMSICIGYIQNALGLYIYRLAGVTRSTHGGYSVGALYVLG